MGPGRRGVPVLRSAGVLFSRKSGALAGGGSVLIFLGCMSFSIGGRNYEAPSSDSCCEDLLTQKGQFYLNSHMTEDVYYPVPFAHVPNLEFTNKDDCVLVEQKEDHFRIRNGSWETVRVKWKARGIRVPAVAPVPPPGPGSVLPPTLPAEPVPVPVERQPSPGPK